MSDSIQSYSVIFGKIVDSKGNPLSGVGVTLTLSGSITPPKSLSSSSSNDGSFSYRMPSTDVDPKNTKLLFTKENFKVKDVNRIQESSRSEKNNEIEILYEIPRITLRPGPDMKEVLQNKVKTDLAVVGKGITDKQIKEDFQTKIANNINNKLDNTKQILLPYVINILMEFGPTVAQQVIDKNMDPNSLSSITTCPLPSTLEELIIKRNNLVQQLNNSYESITRATKALNISEKVVKAIQVGLTLYQLNPYPTTGVPPLGLPPLTAGQIVVINISVAILQTLLSASKVNIDVLTISLGEYGYFLALLLDYLNQIDTLLQFCASQPPVTETTIGLTADQVQELYAASVLSTSGSGGAAGTTGATGTAGALPPTALNFEQVNNQINALANSAIKASQTAGSGNTYKGFKLELKINEKNTSKFIQRYAQAVNVQGVPVLKTEPSFASDPQILIDQLKFIIDSNPNLTAQ
jgi:hypothetical protein